MEIEEEVEAVVVSQEFLKEHWQLITLLDETTLKMGQAGDEKGLQTLMDLIKTFLGQACFALAMWSCENQKEVERRKKTIPFKKGKKKKKGNTKH